MFKLMKQITETAADFRPAKGAVLGTGSGGRGMNKIDAPSRLLIGFCAYAFGELDGRILIALERHFKIAPNDKPALRKYISDRFDNPPSLAANISQFRSAFKGGARAGTYHQSCVLMSSLCKISHSSGYSGRDTLQKLIAAGKALALPQDEILEIFTKTGLAA
jgi:hypothetical protein